MPNVLNDPYSLAVECATLFDELTEPLEPGRHGALLERNARPGSH